ASRPETVDEGGEGQPSGAPQLGDRDRGRVVAGDSDHAGHEPLGQLVEVEGVEEFEPASFVPRKRPILQLTVVEVTHHPRICAYAQVRTCLRRQMRLE